MLFQSVAIVNEGFVQGRPLVSSIYTCSGVNRGPDPHGKLPHLTKNSWHDLANEVPIRRALLDLALQSGSIVDGVVGNTSPPRAFTLPP